VCAQAGYGSFLSQIDFIFSGDQFSGLPVRLCFDLMNFRNSSVGSSFLQGTIFPHL
jgi:hypothetical protein